MVPDVLSIDGLKILLIIDWIVKTSNALTFKLIKEEEIEFILIVGVQSFIRRSMS